jgi:pimeloyl-ACP methyl ester carboxylesterase
MGHSVMRIGHWVALLVVCYCACGCAPLMTTAIVSAPNRWNPFAGHPEYMPPPPESFATDEHFYVNVGPPEAKLSVSVIEPRTADAELRPPRGTVLVVHGIRNRGFWMLRTAELLADEGYRAVLVDLRGHGHSSGEWLTYGPQEAKDLTQVIDDLDRRGLVAGKLGVYGISYGATTAIHLASIDPRVEAVVAVAPFDSMRDEVPHYLRTMLPGIEKSIADESVQAAINQAGEQGSYDPDAANASAAIQKVNAPVLIMHGTNDWLVPPENARRLEQASGGCHSVVMLPGEGHISIWFDAKGEVADRTKRWFDRWLQ